MSTDVSWAIMKAARRTGPTVYGVLGRLEEEARRGGASTGGGFRRSNNCSQHEAVPGTQHLLHVLGRIADAAESAAQACSHLRSCRPSARPRHAHPPGAAPWWGTDTVLASWSWPRSARRAVPAGSEAVAAIAGSMELAARRPMLRFQPAAMTCQAGSSGTSSATGVPPSAWSGVTRTVPGSRPSASVNRRPVLFPAVPVKAPHVRAICCHTSDGNGQRWLTTR